MPKTVLVVMCVGKLAIASNLAQGVTAACQLSGRETVLETAAATKINLNSAEPPCQRSFSGWRRLLFADFGQPAILAGPFPTYRTSLAAAAL